MRVPSRRFVLGHGLVVAPRDVGTRAWQAHLIKHPFGTGALSRLSPVEGTRRWNMEGWDSTEPAVLDVGTRRKMVGAIRTLGVEGSRCRVRSLHREEYAGERRERGEPCYACHRPLAAECYRITESVGRAYGQVVDEVLAALEDPHAIAVERTHLHVILKGLLTRPGWAQRGVVLSLGKRETPKGWLPLARVHRGDGVRVELTHGPDGRVWRTTLRAPPTNLFALITFLFDLAPLGPTPVSERCLVPRLWWEEASK